jgi:hypothetical protein
VLCLFVSGYMPLRQRIGADLSAYSTPMKLNSLRNHKWLALFVGSLFITSSAFAAVSTPVVTVYPQFASSSPVTVSGTADASTTVTIAGGASTSTTSVNGSGNWTASVPLNLNMLNSLSITADDGMGSTSSSTMIDITFDNMAPVFGTTTDIMATTTSGTGGSVTYTNPIVTDNLSASTTAMCAPASGTSFALGTTTVTCTASDQSGNSASTTFDVILTQVTGGTGSSTASTTPGVNITAPIITNGSFCTAISPLTINGMVDANTNLRVTGGNGTATTTSNGSGAFTLSVNLNANSTNPLIVSTLDSGGHVASTTSFNVIYDTIAPVISFTGPTTTAVFANSDFHDTVSATDNFDTSVTATSTGDFDIATPGTYTLHYTATDCAGNTATTTRTIEVVRRSGGTSGVGGQSHSIPPGLIVAVNNANPNSAVATVLAGFIIDGRAQLGIPFLPNTGIELFTRVLKQGDRGEDVAMLQTRLGSTGIYKGPVTGYFGVLTAAAVRSLQRGLGLTVTGSLDASTIAVLNNS